MTPARRSAILTVVTSLLCCLAAGCSSGQAAQQKGAPAVTGEEAQLVLAAARVDLTAAAIRSPQTARLVLRTPEGRTLALIRTGQERIGAAGIAWHGRLADDPTGSATIVENRGAVAGMIHSRAGTYRLRGGRDGVYIDRLDPRRFPNEAEPIARPGLRDDGADPAADTCATDSGDNIDVLVVYTDDARAAAGGTAAMEAEVYLAVSLTNQSYVNSNITQRLRLVHTDEVNYTESANSLTDLGALRSSTNALGIHVRSMRDTFAADVVMMITQTLEGGICGRAYLMTSVGNAFNVHAFGLTKRSCASGNLSFAHELGHQMSARHNWESDPTNNSPYAFNHGHRVAQEWRTVMAYACYSNPECGRVPYWSNPYVYYNGEPTGIATGTQPRNNAQALNLTGWTVANFRCSSAGRTDVWMKDRWNDTGTEPEPLTAGQPMWESPYIWVRNSQDNMLVQQHQHEDPDISLQNWAYVKLHNGGPLRTGKLHLYYGAASSGLVWPSSFTQIGAIPVTIPANSTKVVEMPWLNLPSVGGHFCLVARWVSTADPMNAEGSDINANTIANNNIVWRNVNIVDSEAIEQPFSLIVRNTDRRSRAATTLRFHFPRNANGLSFARFGQAGFEIDPRFLRMVGTALRPSALTGRQGSWTLQRGAEVAELRGLVLPPGAEGWIRIRLRRPPANAPRDVFRMRVEQWQEGLPGTRAAGVRSTLIGGVSYDIRTGSGTIYVPPRGQ